MANPARTRKRVRAIPRASDGSAFQKCDDCGVMVPVALADMHQCGADTKTNVKRFRGVNTKPTVVKQSFSDQPRSPFRLFMEAFVKTCNGGQVIDIERKGFERWRNMSNKERQSYVDNANTISEMYIKSLIQEIDNSPEVDDEADSAMVGKFDPFYEDSAYDDDSGSFCSWQYKGFDSFNTWEWEMVRPWVAKSSDH